MGVSRLETKNAPSTPPRSDRMNDNERDPQSDRQPNRHGYQLQRSRESRDVRRRGARVGIRGEGEESAVAEAAGELEQDTGDLENEG